MKKAFTLIELVFVIVVIGILAATIMPSTKTNPLQEAAIQVMSHINYTQHLAMLDDKYDSSDSNWYKKRWQIVFGTNTNSASVPAYTIFSDTAGNSTGDIQDSEVARNPQNRNEVMSGGTTGTTKLEFGNDSFIGMKKMNLGKSYGITEYKLSEGCSGAKIAFDYLGRPMKGDLSGNASAYESDNLIQTDCKITLSNLESNISIIVKPETGYTYILQ